jgi:hypothetical protein
MSRENVEVMRALNAYLRSHPRGHGSEKPHK